MILRLCLLMFLFGINFGYNIVVIPGYYIEQKTYKPLINNIEYKLIQKNITCKFSFANVPLLDCKEETIIIAHSFGGFFGLLNCIKDNKNIKACILINSHFNQRFKMPYFSIPLKCVTQPVLTILTRDDKTLPLKNALDDFCISIEEKIKNKFFIINNGDHMSSLTNDDELKLVTSQIVQFIERNLIDQILLMPSSI